MALSAGHDAFLVLTISFSPLQVFLEGRVTVAIPE